ncbi:MAG: VWA domain-containing protein [Deltaproteobacteria bacterium]|nr:VWA domain-containing protein [Deltaproteobacteria bacterium]
MPERTGTISCEPARTQRVIPDGGIHCQRFSEIGVSCQETFTQAGASDIIFVVDNSGSMAVEVEGIRENLNAMARTFASSGLDYHVVMVTERGDRALAICVPQPLAGSGCSDSERFRHVNRHVESNDGPDILLRAVHEDESFRGFMREGSLRSIVFVTDDNADMSASAFLAGVAAEPLLASAVVHGVIGPSSARCPDQAAGGVEYEEMARTTGGLTIPICCDQYDRLMEVLAQDIAAQNGRYVLERPALAASIRVFFDGSGGRTAVTEGWTYNAELHAVEMDAAHRPAAGQSVVIAYTAQ